VVQLAIKALDSSNVNYVLPWVQENDEPEIRRAFDHAVSVRKLSPDAKALADRHFFETLVRIHRAGEGAPFTGLKRARRDVGQAAARVQDSCAQYASRIRHHSGGRGGKRDTQARTGAAC
jgi:hypothetical protein